MHQIHPGPAVHETIDPVTPLVRGRVPEDVEQCVGLWIRALRHRDGHVDEGPVSDRTRAVFGGVLLRFTITEGPMLNGFAVTVPRTAETAVLERIAVRPGLTRRGIGRALLLDAIASSREAGCTALELAVRRGNPAALLYESLGFRRASEPIAHPLGGEPMITYRLGL